MGYRLSFNGLIKFLEVGFIMHKIKSAKPPNPNLQTETSTPDIPDNFTKNSELA